MQKPEVEYGNQIDLDEIDPPSPVESTAHSVRQELLCRIEEALEYVTIAKEHLSDEAIRKVRKRLKRARKALG
jgi:hypothetical protein